MDQDAMKRSAAAAALEFVQPDTVIGVGSGSTVALFIELLAVSERRSVLTIPSSAATERLLRAAGFAIVEIPRAPTPSVYVDGADQVDPELRLLKGRGGAHTREKVVAAMASWFVCIVDDSKTVSRLTGPIPLEVLPVARRLVENWLAERGATSSVRECASDDGNLLMDALGLAIDDPDRLELELEALPGVIASGLFARRRADVVLRASAEGVASLTRPPAPPPPWEHRRTP